MTAGMLGVVLCAVAWATFAGSRRTEARDGVPLSAGAAPVIIADFQADSLGQPPAVWCSFDGSALVPATWDHMRRSECFAVQAEAGQRFVRARSAGQAIKIIRPNGSGFDWSLQTHPVLRWNWRATRLPPGAREDDKRRNDAGAAVYVTFGKDWLGRLRMLKYTYSSSLAAGATASYGNLKLIVASSAIDGMGEWVSVARNVREDYRQLFGHAPPDLPTSIWLWSDSDTMGGVAQADFDDLVIASSGPP